MNNRFTIDNHPGNYKVSVEVDTVSSDGTYHNRLAIALIKTGALKSATNKYHWELSGNKVLYCIHYSDYPTEKDIENTQYTGQTKITNAMDEAIRLKCFIDAWGMTAE